MFYPVKSAQEQILGLMEQNWLPIDLIVGLIGAFLFSLQFAGFYGHKGECFLTPEKEGQAHGFAGPVGKSKKRREGVGR